MSVHTLEEDGDVREQAVEQILRRIVLAVPVVLVPTAAEEPGEFVVASEITKSLHDFLVRPGSGEVALEQAGGIAVEVAMRVDESGKDGRALEVDYLGCVEVVENILVEPDALDSSAVDGEGFRNVEAGMTM